MKLPEIDAKRFYTIGKYMFVVIGLMAIVRLIDSWSLLQSYDYLSSIAGIVFNFLLAGFFGWLQGKEDYKEITDSDIFKMNEALDNLNLEGGKTNAQKNRTRRK